jgi:hypothetical protein
VGRTPCVWFMSQSERSRGIGVLVVLAAAVSETCIVLHGDGHTWITVGAFWSHKRS